jgi:hypothetical protein
MSSGASAAGVTPSDSDWRDGRDAAIHQARPGFGLGGRPGWRPGRISALRSRSGPARSPSGAFAQSAKAQVRAPRTREGRSHLREDGLLGLVRPNSLSPHGRATLADWLAQLHLRRAAPVVVLSVAHRCLQPNRAYLSASAPPRLPKYKAK